VLKPEFRIRIAFLRSKNGNQNVLREKFLEMPIF